MRETLKTLPILGYIFLWLGNKRRRVWKIFRRYKLYWKNIKTIKRNLELKDKFKDKKAFVLACGPSINKQDLKHLAGEFCVSVSNFFVHPDFKIIKPEYHVFAESHTPITEEQMLAWLQDAEKHFSEGQKIMMSIGDKELVNKHKLFKKQKVYYYSIDEIKHAKIKKVDFAKQIPSIQTVAHQALYLAIYSGSKEIYLLGVDHDTILHLGESRHFYKENENALARKGLSEWTHPDWLAHFRAYVNLWEIYHKINNYSKHMKINIYNATPGSLLDIFPRVDLKLLTKAK